jgi:hypothetical protein
MMIILFLLGLKSLFLNSSCFRFLKEESFNEATFSLFREVVVVACGTILIQALNYYGLIKMDKEQAVGATYCILMAILLWTILGFIFMKSAQKQVEKWREIEQIATDYPRLERLKHQYETTYYSNQRNSGVPAP